MVWLGAFVGAFIIAAMRELISNRASVVIPGTIFFSIVFSRDFLFVRRRASLGVLFIFSCVVAIIDSVAPYLINKWSPLTKSGQQVLSLACLISCRCCI
jgi:hypothetical protein